jgi:hypothetical protein
VGLGAFRSILDHSLTLPLLARLVAITAAIAVLGWAFAIVTGRRLVSVAIFPIMLAKNDLAIAVHRQCLQHHIEALAALLGATWTCFLVRHDDHASRSRHAPACACPAAPVKVAVGTTQGLP